MRPFAKFTPLGRFQTFWVAQFFLRDLVLIYPTYAIMMQSGGISAVSLATLFVIWSGTALILEVPSGALADHFSRRNLLALAGFITSICFLVWLWFPTWWGYAAGFVIWSIGSSLISGTSESLLYDTLMVQEAGDEFERVYGLGQAAEGVGVMTALLLGGWLAESGYFWPLVLSALGPALASLLVLFTIREPPRFVDEPQQEEQEEGQAHAGQQQTYLATLTSGFRYAVSTTTLRVVLLSFALLVMIPYTLEEYIGPLLAESGQFSLTWVGVLYAAIWLARTVGLTLAHRLRTRSLAPILVGLTLSGGVLALSAFLDPLGVVACVALAFLVSGASEVLLQGYLQRTLDGRIRATVTSVMQMAAECSGLVFFLIIGLVASASSWTMAFGVTGLIAFMAALLLTLAALKLADQPPGSGTSTTI